MRATTNDETRAASGAVDSDDPIVGLLYLLMRDHIVPGKMEENIMDLERHRGGQNFTNGWLAQYAADLVGRLKR